MNLNKYGEILSYRPNIKYNKKLSVSDVGNDADTELNVVNQFIDSAPSSNLVKSNNIIVTAKDTLKRMEEFFFDTKYADMTFLQYTTLVNDGKDKSVDEIYNKALDDINSEIAVEVYKQIHDEVDNVVRLDEMYKYINYGDKNISVNEAQLMEESQINKVLKYEENQKHEKINYTTLFYETKLNKIIYMKLELSSQYINSISDIPMCTNYYEEINSYKEEMKKGLELLFSDVNEKYKNEKAELDKRNSYDDFLKVYKYIVYKISELNECVNLRVAIDSNLENMLSNDIINTIEKKGEEIDYLILELYKIVLSESLVLEKYLETINKKDNIKKIYKK